MLGKTPWDDEQARSLIDARRGEPGAMLPILHDLQERFGYIDSAAIPLIAEALNVSKAETIGVVSFYHDFRREPADGAVLKLCRAESCQALGCEDLVAHLAARPRPRGRWACARTAQRRDGLLPRPLRAVARRLAGRRADRPARSRRVWTRSSPAPRGDRNDRQGLRPRRFLGARRRRRGYRARDRRRSARTRRRNRNRAHGVARALLARTDDRGRNRPRARRLRARLRRPRPARCSRPASWRAARTPNRSAASTKFRISRASSASFSRVAA